MPASQTPTLAPARRRGAPTIAMPVAEPPAPQPNVIAFPATPEAQWAAYRAAIQAGDDSQNWRRQDNGIRRLTDAELQRENELKAHKAAEREARELDVAIARRAAEEAERIAAAERQRLAAIAETERKAAWEAGAPAREAERIAREAERAEAQRLADEAEERIADEAYEAKAFPVTSGADLARRGPVPYILRKTLPAACVGLIYGASGAMKSFAAIYIATGFSYDGQTVLGLTPRNRGRTLIVAAEGSGGMPKRLAGARQALGIPAAAPHMIDVREGAVDMLNDEAVDRLATLAVRGGYKLVIIDTLAKCITGADENSNGLLGKALENLERVRDAAECVVLVIHHSNAHGDSRGATALPNGADVHFKIELVRGQVRISNPKTKDDEPWAEPKFLTPTKVTLEGHNWLDEDGQPEETLALEFEDGPPASVDTKPTRRRGTQS